LFGGQQKEQLPLNINGNFAPPLFKALDCLEGDSQEVGHLLLSLLESLPKQTEFFVIQAFPPLNRG